MDVAALWVSVVGVAIAGLSHLSSRRARDDAKKSAAAALRSARSAEQVAAIEADRRHAEMAPQFDVEWVTSLEPGDPNVHSDGVQISNSGPGDLVSVSARIVVPTPPRSSAAQGLRVLETGHSTGGRDTPVDLGSLAVGQEVFVVVYPYYDDEDLAKSGDFRLELEAIGPDGQQWVSREECTIPHPPRIRSL